MRPDHGLEERPKHVVTSKLHCVNKIIYSQVVLDSLYLSFQGNLQEQSLSEPSPLCWIQL